MLKLVEQDIAGLYVGGTKIKKAYLGETLVFGAGENPPRLPEGYTEVQYIELQSATRYDYFIIPKNAMNLGIRVVLDVEPLQVTSGAYIIYSFIGSSANKNNNMFNVSISSASAVAAEIKSYYGGGGTTSIDVGNVLNRMLIDVDLPNSILSVNGESTALTKPRSFSQTNNLWMPRNSSPFFTGRYYGLKIYYSGAENADYVPAVRQSDNAVGLYDLVSNTFLAQNGSGFTAGPAV